MLQIGLNSYSVLKYNIKVFLDKSISAFFSENEENNSYFAMLLQQSNKMSAKHLAE